MKPEVLIIDDEPLDLFALQTALSCEYQVHAFDCPKEAEVLLKSRPIQIAVLDLKLKHRTGLEILEQWRKNFPQLDIVFCSGESRIDRAMECIRRGAKDFIGKPYQKEQLLSILRNLRKNTSSTQSTKPTEMIGSSPAMEKLREQIGKIRGYQAVSILIQGETGVGKEWVAKILHAQEKEKTRAFVPVNMAAVPASLLESELFGVQKGAYTDAKENRPGKIERANGGDLFLDEIGDLCLESQAKLLRVLQDGLIQRLGSTETSKVRFRVLSATHRNILNLVGQGAFREDLLYRLADVVLEVPPLRERRSDIPELARYFLKKYHPEKKDISNRAMQQLLEHHWPGNIRELESAIKRALIFAQGKTIEGFHFLEEVFYPVRYPIPLNSKNTSKKICESLGISRSTYYRRKKRSE